MGEIVTFFLRFFYDSPTGQMSETNFVARWLERCRLTQESVVRELMLKFTLSLRTPQSCTPVVAKIRNISHYRRVVSVLDSSAEGPGFKSQSGCGGNCMPGGK